MTFILSSQVTFIETVDVFYITFVFSLSNLGTYFAFQLQLPTVGDLFGCYVDFELRRMDQWERIVPAFKYNKEVPFFEMLVPTVDTVRFGYLLEKLLKVNQSVLYTGGTGVGKVRFCHIFIFKNVTIA